MQRQAEPSSSAKPQGQAIWGRHTKQQRARDSAEMQYSLFDKSAIWESPVRLVARHTHWWKPCGTPHPSWRTEKLEEALTWHHCEVDGNGHFQCGLMEYQKKLLEMTNLDFDSSSLRDSCEGLPSYQLIKPKLTDNGKENHTTPSLRGGAVVLCGIECECQRTSNATDVFLLFQYMSLLQYWLMILSLRILFFFSHLMRHRENPYINSFIRDSAKFCQHSFLMLSQLPTLKGWFRSVHHLSSFSVDTTIFGFERLNCLSVIHILSS